jgi:gentisate 1,2-dioxygenase
MQTELLIPAEEKATSEALYFEYSTAADPISSGATPAVPYAAFPNTLYADGPTRVIPLDLSRDLKCQGPASSPALLASYVRILAGEELRTAPKATSELYFVLEGEGESQIGSERIFWSKGDFLTIPGLPAVHRANSNSVMYWVHDEPLLRYLGVRQETPRFEPTKWDHQDALRELEAAANHPEAATRSRVSVLLSNKRFEQTLTITHVLWAMFGLIEPDTRQLPHRHQSVALDLIIDAAPGCYTLVGTELDANGRILNPIRADWQSGAAFVTPPGYWHEHHNESGKRAYLLPIQDAGLHTYLRTLDIRFWQED